MNIPYNTGSTAYSCLTRLPDGIVGLLYEADDYKKIAFVEIPFRDQSIMKASRCNFNFTNFNGFSDFAGFVLILKV
ncbi:MAG: glycoside hydrolase [Bacteroidales bacterium]|nr:glycoside hydrolase [Bacteroidales bacterium]